MAEAFPENQPDIPNDFGRPISILFLATRWMFDTYGLSTVNKSLVNNLRLVDPDAKTILIDCAILEHEGKIGTDKLRDAEKLRVQLRGAKQPEGRKTKPKVKWLNKYIATYYRHLPLEKRYDFIIGHVPYLADGSFNLQDICQEQKSSPKVILMVHALPKKKDGEINGDLLSHWLNKAYAVFSVGQAAESELMSYIRGLEEDNRPIHKTYIPAYPFEFFNIQRETKESKVKGTQNITMMTGERKDLDVIGLDFPLAVAATVQVSKHVREYERLRTNLLLLTQNKEDKEEWKKTFEEREKDIKPSGLIFQVDSPENTEKLKSHMRKSNLFLLPLKHDSPLFGTEALSAIAAGLPILVSRYCGLASLLEKLDEDEPNVVHVTKSRLEIKTWKERILQKLLHPDDAQSHAAKLREKVLLDTSIASTHQDFIKTVAEAACIQLEMELDTDSVVSQEHIEAAIKFGVDPVDPADAKKYIIAFCQKMFFQWEKLDQGLLGSYLKLQIAKMWQEVLSSLENTKRKLVNIHSGSLVFTLFCPGKSSLHQLQDETWRKTLEGKVEELLKLLGVEAQTRIIKPDPLEPIELHMLQRLHKLKVTDSEKQSLGYETMTTMDSDRGSELLVSEQKVQDWFSRQHDTPSSELGYIEQVIQLLDTWNLDHVELLAPHRLYLDNKFTVSESGAVGISCTENPSLSVIYPNTDKSPIILSDDKAYRSAMFVKLLGRELLAANCLDDGNLYLWDIEKCTSKKVFDLKAHVDKPKNHMKIFVMDDRTVGYGEVEASPDRSRRVFILNTGTEEWSLSGMIRVNTKKNIYDMCYVKTVDGTSCLLLCCPHDPSVQAVEMVGGRIRWNISKEQMGEKFEPWSICTDKDNTVYVVDFGQDKLHLLSAEDGDVTKSINLHQYRIFNPFTVRCYEEYLYVEDKIPRKKYTISKFERKLQE